MIALRQHLSSPGAGQKGLCAESPRAVTCRQCPHSGKGEDFLTRQPFFFFTKMAVTREGKVEKLLPRWEMNGLSEGYKQAVDQNWGRMEKIGFFGKKTRFWAPKKVFTFALLEKVAKINISLLRNIG